MAKRYAPGKTDTRENIDEHFATRTRVNDFVRLMRTLPDLDPVLRKMGKGITALQELLTDSHLESVWSVRCAAASGGEWFMAPGDDSGTAKEIAAAFADELAGMNIPQIIEEMMDAVAYGYSPLEVIWVPKGERWGIANIVGKPPHWFEFNQTNKLVMKKGAIATEELPENRFLLVRHRPSYANPYGVKVFSKCYWPVTFKKNGFRWWTVFVEKYGGAFLFGKYPANASEPQKDDLLKSLVKMAADGVAIYQDGTEISIVSAADKRGGSDVHQAYIQSCNAEISKAVLGQTLTTEIGEKGSYAAAAAHNLVRKDIAAADRMRVSSAFTHLAKIYTFYNFGAEAPVPIFQFVEDEDLQLPRAERDVKLHQTGVRHRKEYYIREYGMQEDDFDIQEENKDPFPGFTAPVKHCGCQPIQRNWFQKLQFALFASPAEKQRERDTRLMESFSDSMLPAAQQEIDAIVDTYIDALGMAQDYDDAIEKLGSAYSQVPLDKTAALLDEIRYAASQIGAKSGKGKRRG
jgi:phage gp29-like protein